MFYLQKIHSQVSRRGKSTACLLLWGTSMRHRKTACFEALVLEPHFAQSCGRFLPLYCILGWQSSLQASFHWKMQNVKLQCPFFFPPVWPIRTRLGPYNCVSSEKQECTRTRVVQKLRQIITKTTTNKKQKTTTNKNDPQIPQPDLRFATKQNSEATKNGAGPNKTKKTHSDLP